MEDKSKKGGGKAGRITAVVLVIVGIGIAVKLLWFEGTFRYAGTLEATKIDISSQVASTISDVNVREGDHVASNQLLVQLACPDIIVADELATTNYERNLRLFRSGTASRETLDQVTNRKSDGDIRLSWCKISSPLNATVLNRYHEPGEWVSVGTKLLTLANIKDIWAYIYVAQPEIWRLKPGEKLKGYLPEMQDRVFMGTILKVNSEAEFTPKNVQTRAERERLVYGVKVSFLGSNDEEILKPGMTIEIVLPR